MDLQDTLKQLDEPDPTAVDRVWSRYQQSRAPTRWMRRLAPPMALAAAALLAVALWPEAERTLTLDTEQATNHTWSDQVHLEADGHGTVRGTSREVWIDWQSGTIRAEVEPHTGTEVTVFTAEGTVEVIGTVFSVTRDRLGVTVGVDKGRVKVSCMDGWSGVLTAQTPTHTCLPTTAAQLLGRADALLDEGASEQVLLRTLDHGIELAEAGPVRGELLARRMRLHGEAGRTEAALSDARAYLEDDVSRAGEIRRFAGWLALSNQGCDAALPWLSALGDHAEPRDDVLLAECVATTEPERARSLLEAALPQLDDDWRARAETDLATLEESP